MTRRPVGNCAECGLTTRGELCLACRDGGVKGDTEAFADLIAKALERGE